MDEIHSLFLGNRNNPLNIEIGGYGSLPLPYEVSFVGFEAMNAKTILFGVDGNCTEVQFGCAAKNTHSYFATISG